MNPNQIKQLEKLAKVFNTENVISPEDIAQVVKGIAEIVKTERENVKNLSEEHKQLLQSVINTVSDEHDKVLASIENTSQKAVSDATEASTKAIEEMKRLCNEIMLMKPENGKDADEEYIIERVLSEIKLPEYKETVLDNAEQIKDKLSSLEGEKRLDISAIKGAEKLSTQANLDRAISILDQRTQFLINKTNTSSSGGGGGTWGSITGTLSDQTDLQSALNAKQATLVSGTNIKTINGASLLGSGDISISGVGTGTANTIAYWDTTTSIASLATASYPSLTEISYVKGVTSAIQTQLNAKQASGNYITALTGDVTASGPGSVSATIANDAVTYAKIQNVSAASKLLGRGSAGGAGDVEEITLGTGLSMSGTTLNASGTPLTLQTNSVANGSQTLLNLVAGTNVTLTDNGTGSVTIDAAGGGGTPAGSSLTVQYNNAGAFGGMSGTSWDDTNRALTITGATVTTSKPILDLTQTWNAGAVTFTGLKLNVTNTASAAASLLMDLQVGGSSKFSVQKDGKLTITGPGTAGTAIARFNPASGASYVQINDNGTVVIDSDSGSGTNPITIKYNGSTVGTWNYQGGLNTNNFITNAVTGSFSYGGGTTLYGLTASAGIDMRYSTTSQSFRVYKTYTDSSNYERIALNGTSTANWVQVAAETAGTGGDNINIALTPSGTGAKSAHIPDNTATGGNARGAYAVDWQTARTNAADVAAGPYSTISGGRDGEINASHDYGVIAGGNNNVISGTGNNSTISGGGANTISNNGDFNTISGGSSNTASSNYCTIGGGTSNTASGQTSTVSGGSTNTASGSYSWIPGGLQATARGLVGAYAYSSGQRSALGDAQVIGQPVRATTTDATPKSLATDGTAAATTVMVLPNNSVGGFVAKVACISGSNGGYWEVRGTMYRGANAAATALIGTTTVQAFGVSAALSTCVVDVIADTTLGAAVIQVTGVAATTIQWKGTLELEQVL